MLYWIKLPVAPILERSARISSIRNLYCIHLPLRNTEIDRMDFCVDLYRMSRNWSIAVSQATLCQCLCCERTQPSLCSAGKAEQYQDQDSGCCSIIWIFEDFSHSQPPLEVLSVHQDRAVSPWYLSGFSFSSSYSLPNTPVFDFQVQKKSVIFMAETTDQGRAGTLTWNPKGQCTVSSAHA